LDDGRAGSGGGIATLVAVEVRVKQLIYMCLLTGLGTVGALVNGPYWAVFVYYHFAVLRPQFLWEWSLPRDVSWSFYVAIAAIVLTAAGQGSRSASAPVGPNGTRISWYSGVHVWMLLFSVWVTLTYFTAYSQEAAYPWLIENLKIFTMFFVGAMVVRTIRGVWSLYIMTAFTLGYIAYEVNFAYFVNGYMSIWSNGYGGYDNNGAGLMLAMGVPLCLFVWDGTHKWYRWLAAAMIPFLMHGVILTFSRGAMVSVITASPFCWLLSRHRKQIGLAGVLTALFLVPAMAGKEVRARFLTVTESEVDASANSRRQSWKAAWNIALDYPITGVGVRNANLFSYQYGADMQGRTIHNQYLQVAADCGFVGVGLYLALLFSLGTALYRTRQSLHGRDDDEGRQAQAIVSGVMSSGIVFCIGAIFLSLDTFELTYLLMLLGAQVAVIVRQPALLTAPFSGATPCSIDCETI
jgi:probable O-glycosylation ligase (exosortase A-associated)